MFFHKRKPPIAAFKMNNSAKVKQHDLFIKPGLQGNNHFPLTRSVGSNDLCLEEQKKQKPGRTSVPGIENAGSRSVRLITAN